MIWPSKKVLSAFVLVGALVASIIIAFGKDKSSEAINFASDLVAGEKVSIPQNPSWQSELDRTALSAEILEEGAASTTETTTDLISKSLMANYLALKQSGNLDEASAQKLVEQTLETVKNSNPVNIEKPQLDIVPNNGRQSLIEYGEMLGTILKENKPLESKDEFTIFQQALEKRSTTKLEELDEAIKVYENVASEMLIMPVPQISLKAHTDTVIGLQAIIFGLKDMKTVFDDPIRGLRGLQTFQDGGSLFLGAMQATMGFIKQSGITYKQGSGGYYLLNGI